MAIRATRVTRQLCPVPLDGPASRPVCVRVDGFTFIRIFPLLLLCFLCLFLLLLLCLLFCLVSFSLAAGPVINSRHQDHRCLLTCSHYLRRPSRSLPCLSLRGSPSFLPFRWREREGEGGERREEDSSDGGRGAAGVEGHLGTRITPTCFVTWAGPCHALDGTLSWGRPGPLTLNSHALEISFRYSVLCTRWSERDNRGRLASFEAAT